VGEGGSGSAGGAAGHTDIDGYDVTLWCTVHPHAQLVALPIIPRLIDAHLKYARDFYKKHGVSVFRRMVGLRARAGARERVRRRP